MASKHKHQEGFEIRMFKGLSQAIMDLIGLPFRKKGVRVDADWFKAKWQLVEQSSGQAALIQADNLLDAWLKHKVSGETMGERLKKAADRFSPSTYEALWQAHKLRNKLVHEADHKINDEQVSIALAKIRKALQEAGVL